MELLAGLLIIAGLGAAAYGGIWLLIVTFRKSIRWGLANAFLPFASILFLCLHFQLAWRPFALGAGGMTMIAIGLVCLTQSHPELMDDPIRAAQEGRLDQNGNRIPVKPVSDSH